MSFLLIGRVRMPEYFHLLFKPKPADSIRRILQARSR
jgi:hypothetical protein